MRRLGLGVGLAAATVVGASAAAMDGRLQLELNKLEQTATACRAYLVIENGTDSDLASLDIDLVTFEPSGVIGSRFRIELAPVPAAKTVVKSFDFEGVECGRVARVLLNDIVACAPLDRAACLAGIELRALTAELFK